MANNLEEVNKHVKACMYIFVSLMVLTVVTVLVAFLKVPTVTAIVIALTIASIKGTLVVLYFMHMISEKPLIYITMAMTLLFFGGCMILTFWSDIDPIRHLIHENHWFNF